MPPAYALGPGQTASGLYHLQRRWISSRRCRVYHQQPRVVAYPSPVEVHQEKSKSKDLLFSIQAEGLAYHRRTMCGAYHQRRRTPLYLMLVLAHRLHGGTPCCVPSLTEHSQSNRAWLPRASTDSLTLDYHAIACIYLRLDDIQHFVLMICNFYETDDIQGNALILRLLIRPVLSKIADHLVWSVIFLFTERDSK